MRKILAIIAICVLAITMPAVAFAAGGGGGGGGNGGGSGEPLVVESASIEEGATLDSVDSITLVFSKNVCEASVRDANLALGSVIDAKGNAVAAKVVLADDQVEPDKRNDMVFQFEKPLAAGTYKVIAKAGITSTSGDSLAEDYVLNFTVKGAAASGSTNAVPIIIGAVVIIAVIAGVLVARRKK